MVDSFVELLMGALLAPQLNANSAFILVIGPKKNERRTSNVQRPILNLQPEGTDIGSEQLQHV